MGCDTVVTGWETKDALRAVGINTTSGERTEDIRYGALDLSQRERDLVNEAVDMALVAERAYHASEVADLQRACADWKDDIEHECAEVARLQSELATRERDAFMAGVHLRWEGIHNGQALWRFDAQTDTDWDPSDLDEALDAYVAQRDKV